MNAIPVLNEVDGYRDLLSRSRKIECSARFLFIVFRDEMNRMSVLSTTGHAMERKAALRGHQESWRELLSVVPSGAWSR